MGKGKDYENELVNKIDRATGRAINVYPVGYSGSHATTAEDLLVTDASTGMNHAIELKKRASEYCYFPEEEIEALVNRQNANTSVYLVVSFSNREVLVVRYFDSVSNEPEYNDLSAVEKFQVLIPDAFDPRVTDSGKLAISKPSLDDWPSARGGSDDEDAILSGLGVNTENSVSID